jgi:hypothetical protein
MLNDQLKALLLDQFKAFQHAIVDDAIVLVEARRKSDGKDVLIACMKLEVTIPPRVMGGEPTKGEQMIPMMEFIDPMLAENPYLPADAELVEIKETGLVDRDGQAITRQVKPDAAA